MLIAKRTLEVTMCQKNNNTKKQEKKYSHLNYIERTQIERWYNKDKKSKKEIAELLRKSERTIRREIKRGIVTNLTHDWQEIYVYSADVAQEKYEYHKTGKGPSDKIGKDFEFVEYIETGIKKDKKSPEILIAEIKKEGKTFKAKVCAKTIRNRIKKGDTFNIKAKDMIYKKVYKEKNKAKAVCSKVPAEKSIEYRPKGANLRSEYGHWEGDLVIGTKERSACLLTLTERKTREEIIIKIKNKSAKEVAGGFDKLEKKYGKSFYQKFKTITFDNGGEFRNYKLLEKSCRRKGNRINIYYAHPYRSGERGTNENANRLIRRFIPKGKSMLNISEERIQEIEDWINNLPRKMFGYKTALEIKREIFA